MHAVFDFQTHSIFRLPESTVSTKLKSAGCFLTVRRPPPLFLRPQKAVCTLNPPINHPIIQAV